MKLYATVSSERASKGQGGNEYIDIDVFDDKGDILARLVLMEHGDETSKYSYILAEDGHYRDMRLEIRAEQYPEVWDKKLEPNAKKP